MNKFLTIVLPVYLANIALSVVGFAWVISLRGMGSETPHVELAVIWTFLLVVQMVLAEKKHPAHKWVGRVALIILFVSMYDGIFALVELVDDEQNRRSAVNMVSIGLTGVAAVIYAAIGVWCAIRKNYEAHAVAMLIAGAMTMTAGQARASSALFRLFEIPGSLSYSLAVLSIAAALWVWRPSQRYLIASYALLMMCMIFLE